MTRSVPKDCPGCGRPGLVRVRVEDEGEVICSNCGLRLGYSARLTRLGLTVMWKVLS